MIDGRSPSVTCGDRHHTPCRSVVARIECSTAHLIAAVIAHLDHSLSNPGVGPSSARVPFRITQRRESCMLTKELTLIGRRMTFTAPDGDHYLGGMAEAGPVDLLPVLTASCHPGDTVIDVGANIGVRAVMSALLTAPGRVVALEPVPETFVHLEQNCSGSKIDNLTCVHAAIGAVEGTVKLVTRTGSNFAAFVGYEGVLDRYVGYDEYEARVLTVDRLVKEQALTSVDFMKIDVEGYELEVLRGAASVLNGLQPVVFLEANHYCLNVFRRTSIVDFLDEILAFFPFVRAVDTTLNTVDLTQFATHHNFFHDNVVLGRFPNLLCGFDGRVAQIATALRGQI